MLIFALAYWGRIFLFVFWEDWKKQKAVSKLTDLYLTRDGKSSPTSSYPCSYWMPPNLIFIPIWNIKYQGVNWGSIDSFYFKFSRTCTHQIYSNPYHLNLHYIKSGNYSLLFVYFKRLIFVIAWLAASLNNSSISAKCLQKCKVRHLALKICNWRLYKYFLSSLWIIELNTLLRKGWCFGVNQICIISKLAN